MVSAQLEAQEIVKRVAENYKPERIILFGSFARGEEREDSDIDLLVIKKSEKKRPFRVKEVFEAVRGIDRDHTLDPIVYTPDELARRVSLGDYFIKKVLDEGKVMYES
jgi:predicted nucleotidyltransferase